MNPSASSIGSSAGCRSRRNSATFIRAIDGLGGRNWEVGPTRLTLPCTLPPGMSSIEDGGATRGATKSKKLQKQRNRKVETRSANRRNVPNLGNNAESGLMGVAGTLSAEFAIRVWMDFRLFGPLGAAMRDSAFESVQGGKMLDC